VEMDSYFPIRNNRSCSASASGLKSFAPKILLISSLTAYS